MKGLLYVLLAFVLWPIHIALCLYCVIRYRTVEERQEFYENYKPRNKNNA